MIAPELALLMSGISALLGAGLTYFVVARRGRSNLHTEEPGAAQQRARELVELRKQRDQFEQQLAQTRKENAGLRHLLELPEERGAGLPPRQLDSTFHEIAAMKHVSQYAAISPRGFILFGDERDPHTKSLAAATGICLGLEVIEDLEHILLRDTLGNHVTLYPVHTDENVLTSIIAIWSRGADIPRSVMARQKAQLGLEVAQGTARGTSKTHTLAASDIEQGGALERLVTSAQVLSVTATSLEEGLLFKQGNQAKMWPGDLLVRMGKRFFASRAELGCGELERIVLVHPSHTSVLDYTAPTRDHGYAVEIQLAPQQSLPDEAIQHAVTQLGWHLQSSRVSEATVQDVAPIAASPTPEKQASSQGAI